VSIIVAASGGVVVVVLGQVRSAWGVGGGAVVECRRSAASEDPYRPAVVVMGGQPLVNSDCDFRRGDGEGGWDCGDGYGDGVCVLETGEMEMQSF
jgi:hypothetical protein